MNPNRLWIQVARWCLAGLLCLLGLWALKLTAFNFWAAGGPPTPHPEIYARRAWAFLAVTVCFFVGAGLITWFLRRRGENEQTSIANRESRLT